MIGPDETLLLAAVLLVLTAVSMAAENTRWGRAATAPLIILIGAMLLANANVIPHEAPLYSVVSGFFVPAAIPMLLMRADLKRVVRESGPMLLAFTVAVTLTIVGCFVAAALVDMGEYEAAIAAALTASYIGGSLNFVSTAQTVGLDGSTYVAALSADVVGAVLFLVLLMLLPSLALARRWMPSRFIEDAQVSVDHAAAEEGPTGRPFNLLFAANGVALSLVICSIAQALVSWMGYPQLFIVSITIVALLVANLAKPLLRYVAFEFEIGMLFMFVFFAAIGAGADIFEVVDSALPASLFIVLLVLVHLLLLLPIGRWLKLDLAEAMVASNACILGPPTAAALAASKGWRDLVTPGLLVGILGYSIGTFIGIAIYGVLSR
ncbi:MAG: DUF819 family protein [Pseudomonadota bacterium]